MAKAKAERGSKAQAIREEIASGKDNAGEIFAALQARGIQVNKPSIYTALTKARADKKRGVGRNGTVSRAKQSPAKPTANNGQGLNVEDLQTLAMCATKLGGWNRLGAFIAAIS